jgi:hypothetical protein
MTGDAAEVAMAAFAGRPVLARIADRGGIAAALAASGIGVGGDVIVIVGGAGGMDDATAEAVVEMMRDAVLPTVVRRGATVLDGGTDSGVMRLVGRARAESGGNFPLVGVAAEGTVTVPGSEPPTQDAADLEPHHTHVLLVPGTEWGAEAPWISDVAEVVADGSPSVTLLINGGGIAFDDAARSLEAGRPLVVVAGSGRTADAIADARTTGEGDRRAVQIAASPLTRIVLLDDPEAIAFAIAAGLGEPANRT